MIPKPNQSECTASIEYIEKYKKWDYRKLEPYISEAGNKIRAIILYGGRDTGKSTNNGKIILEDAYKGKKFVYIVRDNLKTTTISGYFAKWDSRVKNTNKEFYIEYELPDGTITAETIGYIIPLTLEENYKSGYDFSDVYNIIFEEFTCISVARYIDNEVIHLMSLFSTIERDRLGEVKMYCIGNNNTPMNDYCPLFTALGIDYPSLGLKQGESRVIKDGKIYIERVAPGINPDKDKSILSLFSYACNDGEYESDIEILDCDNSTLDDSVIITTKNNINLTFSSENNYIVVHTTETEAQYNILNPCHWCDIATYIDNLDKMCRDDHIPTLYADAKSKYEFQFLLRDIEEFGRPKKAK